MEQGTILAFSEATLAKSLHGIFNNGRLASMQKPDLYIVYCTAHVLTEDGFDKMIHMTFVIPQFLKQKTNRWKM
jgi:hypothetical protein